MLNFSFGKIGNKGSDTRKRLTQRVFTKNRFSLWAVRWVQVLLLISLFADFIANEKPLVAQYKQQLYFPVVKDYLVKMGIGKWSAELKRADWKTLQYDWKINAPIPYSPYNIDKKNDQSVSPLAEQVVPSIFFRHWLGTDEIGHDVLSCMVHGARIAFLVGLSAMTIAGVIGILLGAMAGYFMDSEIQLTRRTLFTLAIGLVLGCYYGFMARKFDLEDAAETSLLYFGFQCLLGILIVSINIFALHVLTRPLRNFPYFRRKLKLPIDLITMRSIEVLISIPTLFLIIAIIAIAKKPNLVLVILVIGLTAWTGIARLMRAEMLKIRQLDYIEASKAMGFNRWRILLKHALPNAMSPIFVALSFGIAGSILIEAFLSFIGIVPGNLITWGSLLAEARINASSWWLALFPGLAIFVTVTLFNQLGEDLASLLHPERKRGILKQN